MPQLREVAGSSFDEPVKNRYTCLSSIPSKGRLMSLLVTYAWVLGLNTIRA